LRNIRSSFVPQKQIACFVFLLEHALRGIFEDAAIFGLGLLQIMKGLGINSLFFGLWVSAHPAFSPEPLDIL